MNRLILFLVALVGASSSFAGGPFVDTRVDTEQRTVLFAKSAEVESLPENVALFVDGLESMSSQSLVLRVTTSARFHEVRVRELGSCVMVEVFRKLDGRYYFFGNAGEYQVEVGQSDPEVGIHTDVFTVKIVGESKPPDEIDHPGDLESLRKVACEKASLMDDKPMATALGNAYKDAIALMDGKSLDECKTMAKDARRKALLSVGGSSWIKDWNGGFFIPVDVELSKVSKTPSGYVAGLGVVSKCLLGN